MKKINRISKSEIKEGLTLELVNAISLDKNYSPVQLQKGDEPANILKCSTGFWAMVEGKPLKDANNKMIVFSDKECQIGRARYLMNFGKEEKEKKIQELLAYWRKQLSDCIEKMEIGHSGGSASSLSFLNGALEQMIFEQNKDIPGYEENYKMRKESDKKVKDEIYNHVKILQKEGNETALIEFFEIKKFDSLMLSARFDNEQEMKVLINTFNKEQIDNWQGHLYKYAQIEIEKQYPL